MPDLLYEKNHQGHFATFTMNRPERLNAMGGDLSHLMNEAIADFINDDEMRVGIITGAGRAFSAGADLKETADKNARAAEVEARFQRKEISSDERGRLLAEIGPITGGTLSAARAAASLSDYRKPFIAAVNGLAVAGGCERAMDCDIRICTPNAYFGLYEVKRGFMPGSGIHHAPRLMPFGEAMLMLLTAGNLSAERAYQLGFVQEIVEPDRLLPRAIEIAETIGGNAPLAVQGVKAMGQFWRQFAMSQSRQLAVSLSTYIATSEDVLEGPRAFAEKRAPVWQGR